MDLLGFLLVVFGIFFHITECFHECYFYTERRQGMDIFYSNTTIFKAIDVFLSKDIYFIILNNGVQPLKVFFNQTKQCNDMLQLSVKSAQSIGVDWINENVYWADRANRFIEIVDLSHNLEFPISRARRRAIFTDRMADIDSLVVDPYEQYIFWLQVGADMVVERARLDGDERTVIYRSQDYKSKGLAVDRHRKMLFWSGVDGKISRIDYQGGTHCSMIVKGAWTEWNPSFLTFYNSHLLFINKDALWMTTFDCQPADAKRIDSTNGGMHPIAVVITVPQQQRQQKPSPCSGPRCSSICLPEKDGRASCSCMTGVVLPPNATSCPTRPDRSLFLATNEGLYQMSIDVIRGHLEPVFEHSSNPFGIVIDVIGRSIFYTDYNSNSIMRFSLDTYKRPQQMTIDSHLMHNPVSIAVDGDSQNVYWMNWDSAEVWVARIDRNRLAHVALLLSAGPTDQQGGRRHPTHHRNGNVVVDSINQYLFVIPGGSNAASIDRYWLDGSHKFFLKQFPEVSKPRGLAVDPRGYRIFYVDIGRDEMISMDYDGRNERVIARKFPEVFGLAYMDTYIYWTTTETYSINRIKFDGTGRSQIKVINNFRATGMPILAVSYLNDYLSEGSCHNGTALCKQLCFPTPESKHSYSCGCTSPAYVLHGISQCIGNSNQLVLFNHTSMLLLSLSSYSNRFDSLPLSITWNFSASIIQIDVLRNAAYLVTMDGHCIVKTKLKGSSNVHSNVLCVPKEEISAISIDVTRNNLYVAIKGSIGSRIEIVRLPFHNSDTTWRKLIISSEEGPIKKIVIHSQTRRLYWFVQDIRNQIYDVSFLQKSQLDGTDISMVWSGSANLKSLQVSEEGKYLYWMDKVEKNIIRYNTNTKETNSFQIPISYDHRNPLLWTRSSIHFVPFENHILIYQHPALFEMRLTGRNGRKSEMKTVKSSIAIANMAGIFVTERYKDDSRVAVAKADAERGIAVMCPSAKNQFVSCSHFCLPTKFDECGCATMFSVQDKFSCMDTRETLLALTKTGELVGIHFSESLTKSGESQLTEWIEVPDQAVGDDQKFIDAVYWPETDSILLLDVKGTLSAIQPSKPVLKVKVYKQLAVLGDDGLSLSVDNSYERVYKHFIEKGVASKELYESPRYSMALDILTNTLFWSDWVNGVIVAESLGSISDEILYVGLVADFKHSNRRPLEIALISTTSSLVWISADLSVSSTNLSLIWRNFWIEISDLDGSRRQILVRNSGVLACLRVDVNSGRIYWIETTTNRLMYLNIEWQNYQVKGDNIFNFNMKVTINSLSSSPMGLPSSIAVMNNSVIWTDLSQLAIAVANIPIEAHSISTEKTHYHDSKYLRHKLPSIVKLLVRSGQKNTRLSYIGNMLNDHPCSHIRQATSGKVCSHLCLSTFPTNFIAQLGKKSHSNSFPSNYRCACPLSMVIEARRNVSVCVKSKFVTCEKHQMLCRAGYIYSTAKGLVPTTCMSLTLQCDLKEDCIDGSDETGCSRCNATHPYSCSPSGMCLPAHKRCDGIVDCESDEKCCGKEKFECLSGISSSRCIHALEQCNGIRDCVDNSDETKCSFMNNDPNSKLPNDDSQAIHHLRNNHMVAIITGVVAIMACTVAIVYICVTRRNRHKTVHESCIFRANNLNIMLMSSKGESRWGRRHQNRNFGPNDDHSLKHAKSLTTVDKYKEDGLEICHAQSLTSLSDCYQRIRDPLPDVCSAVQRPLFSIRDDVIFHLSRNRRMVDPSRSSTEVTKRHSPLLNSSFSQRLDNPPPSMVTLTSVDDTEKEEVIHLRRSGVSTPCESELEEIYVHRYISVANQPPALDNYPSCLLQNLLSACNKNSVIISNPKMSYKIRSRHRRKSLKSRSKRRRSQDSSSPVRRYFSYSRSRKDRHSNEKVCPPPPSPITVASN